MTAEEWRPVPGFPGYEISSTGRVKSHYRKAPYLMALVVGNHGYHYVTLRKDKRRINRLIHQLVAEAFHGPKPHAAAVVRHLNGNPLDNRPANLRWGTYSENALDAVRHGTHWLSAKTHCPRGHVYDEVNTYRAASRPRSRQCYACKLKDPANPQLRPEDRTHCPQGHPYDEGNTLIFGDGRRRCRACKNAYRRTYRAAARLGGEKC